MASSTARLATTGAYKPPFKTISNTFALITASRTTISTASIRSSTATTSALIVDATGGVNSNSLLEYFTIPYIDAHTLSLPSWRYAYFFWFAIAGLIIVCSLVLHLSGNGIFSNLWRKISMKRLVVGGGVKKKVKNDSKGRRKSMQKKAWITTPTLGIGLVILSLIALSVTLSLVGDDYISPTTCVFGGVCPYASATYSGPPKTNYKRALDALQSITRRGVNNPNGWAPFNDPLLAGQNTNVARTIWTLAARLGLMSYAVIPLCVSLALVNWPFNVLSTPFLTNIQFDKTAILHRWSGRIVWALATAHSGLWTYQLFQDKDPFGKPVIVDVWRYYRFFAGMVGYVVLTLLVILSFKPVRARFYEFFYWSHIILVGVLLASCIIHSQPLAIFIFAALGLWGADRLIRLVVLLWINRIGHLPEEKAIDNQLRNKVQSFAVMKAEKVDQGHELFPPGGYAPRGAYANSSFSHYGDTVDGYTEEPINRQTQQDQFRGYEQDQDQFQPNEQYQGQYQGQYPPVSPHQNYQQQQYQQQQQQQYQQQQQFIDSEQRQYKPNQRDSYYDHGPGQDSQYLQENNYPQSYASPKFTPPPPFQPYNPNQPFEVNYAESRVSIPALPSSGYAYAQLLPGRTLRLTINSPRAVKWTPGQHLYLTIPSIALFQSHPYTITNVDERALGIAPIGGGDNLRTSGSEIVLIIRAQKGFSKKLWKSVVKAREKKERSGISPEVLAQGVKLRSLISSPMGSSIGTNWGEYETLVILVGGTGITFGISILEYVCRRMARQETSGTEGKREFKTKRIRCVWTIREYAHCAWIAPSLRRCLEMSRASSLQLDIYVSRDDKNNRNKSSSKNLILDSSQSQLSLPNPGFARSERHNYEEDLSDNESHHHQAYSRPSTDSDYDSRESTNEMIFFDGEDTTPTAAELELSANIRKTGKTRRAKSRANQGYNKRSSKSPSPNHPLTLPSRNSSPWHSKTSHEKNDSNNSNNYPPSFLNYDPSPSPSPYPVYGAGGNNGSGFAASGSFTDLGGRPDGHSLGPTSSRRGLIGGEDVERMKSIEELNDEEVYVDVTEFDQADLDAIAELARPGLPKLDKVLDEEIAKSTGKIMVACCGPPALNTTCRNLVSSRINLKKVWKGDQSGNISLTCEDFSY